MRSLVSNSIYAKKDRNGPPSANQVDSKDEPRRGHAVCTLRVRPHPPISKRLVKSLRKCQPAVAEKRALNSGNGAHTRWDRWFLTPFLPKRIEMALPVPTSSLLKTNPDAAMLFAPFRCTHPLPLSRPFCMLTQNLSSIMEVTS